MKQLKITLINGYDYTIDVDDLNVGAICDHMNDGKTKFILLGANTILRIDTIESLQLSNVGTMNA